MKLLSNDAFEVLGIRNYRNYQLGRLLFILGLQMQSVLIAIYVYRITKDPMALGLTGLSEAIPYIITAFFAGNLADLYNRKKIVVMACCGYLLSVLLLTTLIFNATHFSLTFEVNAIYAIVFLTGISRGFFAPAQGALMAKIVPVKLYGQSAMVGSIIWNTACVCGPALGGLFYGFIGVKSTMALILVLCTIGVGFIASIKYQHINLPRGLESNWERIQQGIRYVKTNQIVLSAMLVDMLAVLFGGAVALIPVFADQVLHVGEKEIGLLRAVPSIGAVICSFIVAYFPIKRHAGKWFIVNMFLFGVCMIGFALSRNFYLSIGFLFLSGAFDNVGVIVRSVIFQLYTPDEIRGRVMAINSIFIGSSNEIGSFESGFAARLLGLVPSVVFGGFITLGVAATTAKLAPKLWKLDLK
jgi:MFS family permease